MDDLFSWGLALAVQIAYGFPAETIGAMMTAYTFFLAYCFYEDNC